MVGQGKRVDHRVNALLITHPGWVPEPWQACPGSCLEIAGFTCIRTVLASLQDATVLSPVNRWSFPLQPWSDPPATYCQPSGLDWPLESNGKTSRPPVPTRANPSLMQPWALIRVSFGCLTAFRPGTYSRHGFLRRQVFRLSPGVEQELRPLDAPTPVSTVTESEGSTYRHERSAWTCIITVWRPHCRRRNGRKRLGRPRSRPRTLP